MVKKSLLPMEITANGLENEPVIEEIYCDSISGGAQYNKNMPKYLSLIRELATGEIYKMGYIQAEMPTETPKRGSGTTTWQAMAFLSGAIKEPGKSIQINRDIACRILDMIEKLELTDIHITRTKGIYVVHSSFGSAYQPEPGDKE